VYSSFCSSGVRSNVIITGPLTTAECGVLSAVCGVGGAECSGQAAHGRTQDMNPTNGNGMEWNGGTTLQAAAAAAAAMGTYLHLLTELPTTQTLSSTDFR
jgi:hypothetical protein